MSSSEGGVGDDHHLDSSSSYLPAAASGGGGGSSSSSSSNTQVMSLLWPPPRSTILITDRVGNSRLPLSSTLLVLCPDSLLGSPITHLLRQTLSSYSISTLFCRGCGYKQNEEEGMEGGGITVLKVVVGRELFSVDQSYNLLITSSSMEVTASDARGVLYGLRTLCDIIR